MELVSRFLWRLSIWSGLGPEGLTFGMLQQWLKIRLSTFGGSRVTAGPTMVDWEERVVGFMIVLMWFESDW